MWKRISLDGVEYLFQHRVNEEPGGSREYLILLTDLKVLYSQTLHLDEFTREFQTLNKDLEVTNYEEVLVDMFHILDDWVLSQRQSAASLTHKIKGKPLFALILRVCESQKISCRKIRSWVRSA